MPKPVISVVIIAHDRKQYIRRAIDSALDQTLSRKLYEIIVVKYFKDRKIDGYIKRAGARNIYTREIPMGTKFALGVKASRGDVISFMEDDDFFYRHKLARVYKVFQNPDICYYHNSMTRVDDSGKRLTIPEPKTFGRFGTVSSKFGNPLQFDWSVPACISVRSHLIKRYASEMNGIVTNLEGFIFFAMRTSGKLLYFDNDKLTYHTSHAGTLSNPTFDSYEDFCKKRIMFFEGHLSAIKKSIKVAGKSDVEKSIRPEILHVKAIINLMSDHEVYKLKPGEHVTLLKSHTPVFFALMAHRVLPKTISRLYYEAKMATAYKRVAI